MEQSTLVFSIILLGLLSSILILILLRFCITRFKKIEFIHKTLENILYNIKEENRALSAKIMQMEKFSQTNLEALPDIKQAYPRIIDKDNIKNFIDGNYRDSGFSIQTVMDHFGMTHSNLSHQFKSYMGENISSYINSMKMNYAKELLSTGNLTINEIGRKLGYLQTSSFIKRFKSTEGMTPGEYRSKL